MLNPINKIFLLLPLSLFFNSTLVMAQSAFDIDQQVAKIYLIQAKNAYEQDNIEEASLILEEGSEFSGSYDDFYALSGFIAMKKNRFTEATTFLEKALSNYKGTGVFDQKSILDALYLLYYRQELYEKITSSYLVNPSLRYDVSAFYYLLSLEQEASMAELETQADRLLKYYPEDHRLYFTLLNTPNFSHKYLPNLHFLASITEEPTTDVLEQALLIAAIQRLNDSELKQELLSLSYPWLYNNLNYQRLCKKLNVLVPKLQPTITLDALFEDISLIDLEHYEDSSFASQKAPDIPLGSDSNLDGFPEEGGSFDQDNSYWYYDSNQNGKHGYVIHLNKGLITTIEEFRGSVKLIWEFSNYPYVSQVTVETPATNPMAAKRTLIYYIQPSTIDFNTLTPHQTILPAWPPLPVFKSENDLPSENILLENSSQIDEYLNSIYFRKSNIVNGAIISIAEDSFLRGFFDHLLILENWQVIYGKRDLTGNGQFDVYEYYENGEWRGLAYSPDGDGKPTFFEDNGILKISLWDFNKDGYINAYRIIDPNNTIITLEPQTIKKISAEEFLSWNFSNQLEWFNGTIK